MTITHRKRGTAAYQSWAGMITRCTNPNTHNFSRYGGRGITFCERWRQFENFYADMGDRPPGHTLERINYDGNYEPANCKWLPKSLQARNRACVRLLTIDGVTRPLVEWCEINGIHPKLAWKRMREGWGEADAVGPRRLKPNQSNGTRVWSSRFTEDDVRAIRGSADSCSELARRYGVTRDTISEMRAGHTWKHVT